MQTKIILFPRIHKQRAGGLISDQIMVQTLPVVVIFSSCADRHTKHTLSKLRLDPLQTLNVENKFSENQFKCSVN